MRVMTTKLPWAWLIVNGYKKYELRSQRTRIRERIGIRASTVDKPMVRYVRDNFPRIPLPSDDELRLMARSILGTADMADSALVAELSDVAEGACDRSSSHGRRKHAWVLAGAVPLQRPIAWTQPGARTWSHSPPGIDRRLT
jgi:hypothetical protein